MRLGLLHAATFGLSVVAANWIVPLLERHGEPRGTAAALGSLLLGGLVTRPPGGFVASSRAALVGALVAGAAAFASSPCPLRALLGLAAAVAGLAAGLPFAAVFAGAQRARPDAPEAAIGFVNSWADHGDRGRHAAARTHVLAARRGPPRLRVPRRALGRGRRGRACRTQRAAPLTSRSACLTS